MDNNKTAVGGLTEIAGVNIERLMRNLDETSYNEGSEALACRLADCERVIKELLSTLPAHQAVAAEGVKVPEGFALVPLEPNEGMKSAIWSMRASNTGESFSTCYRAMLAAAPVPPVSAAEEPSQQLQQTGDPDGGVREWMEAHGYGNQTVGFALATLQSRIEAKDRELSNLATAYLARQAQAGADK